jgi:hypothetical protein
MALKLISHSVNDTDGLASGYQLTDTATGTATIEDTGGMVAIAIRPIAATFALFQPDDQNQEPSSNELLARVKSTLGLSDIELSRLFSVSPQTVFLWQLNISPIPLAIHEQLVRLDHAAKRLLGMFRADRLVTVIRRPAHLFNGSSALDWILQGRAEDVADRYDRALAYQA